MNQHSKLTHRLKYLFLIFVVAVSPILPVFQYTADANTTDIKWLTYKLDGFSQDTYQQLFEANGTAEVPDGESYL